ncbi:MAG TPA: hypothetical protein VLA62_09535, partial [Solirubrobacterales bacterium]|nr:hypothetical protein [Solirubrobacterales bacterium]
MRLRAGLLAAPVLAATSLLAAQAPPPAPSDKVIDVPRPPAVNTFEALWESYRRAEDGGDAEAADKTFKEIRRLRTERNAESLEELALALFARGQDRVKKQDSARA